VLAADLQNAVTGENSAILVPTENASTGNASTLLSFLTLRRAPEGSIDPRFLAVRYALTNNAIVRSYGAVGDDETDLINPDLATITPVEPLATGILAIQIRAVTETNKYRVGAEPSANWATRDQYNGIPLPPGYQALLTRSPIFSSAAPNTLALEIWIATIDAQNAALVGSMNRSFNPSDDPTMWREEVDASNLPSQAKASIRVLNKTVPLP